jgi:hypothetical protein
MITPLVFIGLCNAVLTYPNIHASYPVPVRQFRLLPYRLLQCMGRPKPPCGLLMLPGVTPVHKGLTPSGLSFIQRTLLNLPFKAHTRGHKAWLVLGVRHVPLIYDRPVLSDRLDLRKTPRFIPRERCKTLPIPA